MIRLYWKNASSCVPAVGDAHGVTREEMRSMEDRLARALAAVRAEWDAGRLGYAALLDRQPYHQTLADLVGRRRGETTDLVVLGIGGSALGAAAVHTALHPATYNLLDDDARGGPRLFVLDNVDPALVADTLKLLGDRLATTVFNVVSKSGKTAETAAQFLIVADMLGGKTARDRIVVTTDPEDGPLRKIAAEQGYDTLPVPPDVGGRFSVLSPVGLFSAAMCGGDVEALLDGARHMAGRLRQAPPAENPACVLAAIKFLMATTKGKPLHVMMPYSNRLLGLADWYRQLWAESLGKRHDRGGREVFVGPTPVKALGATDQHSQAQLYLEGPNDKLVVFLVADRHPADCDVPAPPRGEGPGYLGGRKLSDFLHAEKVATEFALARAGRPSVTIRFDAVDPESVGAFLFFYEFVTSLMGELLDVNAYDQPGVQAIKDATFALLGRKGYEQLAGEIREFDRDEDSYLL